MDRNVLRTPRVIVVCFSLAWKLRLQKVVEYFLLLQARALDRHKPWYFNAL
jgi:hypothetical protein